MRRIYKTLNSLLVLFGLDFNKTWQTFSALPFYISDWRKLKNQKRYSRHVFADGKPYPCLSDKFTESGDATSYYFSQDLYVAQKIFENNPDSHVDVGSRIDGLVAHVASFRNIKVFDIRKLTNVFPQISFVQADMMSPLDDSLKNYCDSLSCLHALEHFGLGRYGDPVNYDGYLVGLDNLYQILKQQGKLYFSVPIGKLRIEFNAHRVFSLKYLLSLFEGKYKIDSFSYINDNGELFRDVVIDEQALKNNLGCYYGCGIFELTKL